VIHFANDCATLLTSIKTLPVDVIAVDWRIPLDVAAMVVGPDKALQGTWIQRCCSIPGKDRRLRAGGAAPGEKASSHIFNLGHGILPPTNPEHAIAMVEAVHRIGRKA